MCVCVCVCVCDIDDSVSHTIVLTARDEVCPAMASPAQETGDIRRASVDVIHLPAGTRRHLVFRVRALLQSVETPRLVLVCVCCC